LGLCFVGPKRGGRDADGAWSRSCNQNPRPNESRKVVLDRGWGGVTLRRPTEGDGADTASGRASG